MTTATPTSVPFEQVISDLVGARAAGTRWLLSRLGADGRPAMSEVANQYYRLPWALSMAGELTAAAAVLSWVERNALDDEGDLRPGAPQSPWTVEFATYPLSILAIGAWNLERYDVARAIMRTVVAYQDAQTGGVFTERPENRVTGRQEVLSTAQLGMAALTVGLHDVAERAATWFKNLYKAQPDLPSKLYLSWGPRGLITEYPEQAAFAHLLDFSAPRQSYFNAGIAAAFLGRFAAATGDPEARRVGRELVQMSENGTERQFEYADTVHVGKVAWGAASMLAVAPDEGLLRVLQNMTAWLVNCQLADGRWLPSAFLYPSPSDMDCMWKTAEHVMIVNMMLGAIGAYVAGAAA